eukprot:9327831-Pyramimonas_sp.AAC.1
MKYNTIRGGLIPDRIMLEVGTSLVGLHWSGVQVSRGLMRGGSIPDEVKPEVAPLLLGFDET